MFKNIFKKRKSELSLDISLDIEKPNRDKNVVIVGGSGSGRAHHPWDAMKPCSCGGHPLLMYSKDEPYYCGGETENVFALCPKCGKHTYQTDVSYAIDLWNFDIIKEDREEDNIMSAKKIVSYRNDEKSGICYGKDLSGQPIYIDQKAIASKGISPNVLILGSAGSGKTREVKREIATLLQAKPDADIIVLSFDGEYRSFTESFGGEVIQISPGSKNCINPLDTCRVRSCFNDSEFPMMGDKVVFMLGLLETLIGRSFDAIEKTVVDRALWSVYETYMAQEGAKMPTLEVFLQEFRKQPYPEVPALAATFELFIKGPLTVFTGVTSEPTNRFVVYDISGFDSDLTHIAAQIVISHISTKIEENLNNHKKAWIFLDEIYPLMDNCGELISLWCRARTRGAVVTASTQNSADLIRSEFGNWLLSGASLIMLLRQAEPEAREEVVKLFNLSQEEANAFMYSKPGQGLLITGEEKIPFSLAL